MTKTCVGGLRYLTKLRLSARFLLSTPLGPINLIHIAVPARTARPPILPLVEDIGAAFVVKDSTGQKLAYVYYEDEPGQAIRRPSCSAATRRDGLWRISPSCQSWCAEGNTRAGSAFGVKRTCTELQMPSCTHKLGA